jgi:predicted HNH restriction endonuclease
VVCTWHLCKKLLEGRKTKFCNRSCQNKYYVDKRRKDLKIKAVQFMGTSCKFCGYAKCYGALDFHHLRDKSFSISKEGYTRSWEKIKAELQKCILVCKNCHAEIHAGLIHP